MNRPEPAREHARGLAGWHARWHERHDPEWGEVWGDTGFEPTASGDESARASVGSRRWRAELRRRRRASRRWQDRPHRGASLGKRLLATFVAASLLSILLAAFALQWLVSWHPSFALAHGLRAQTEWIEDHLVFDASGRPVALREPPDRAWIYGEATRDFKYRVLAESGAVLLSSDKGDPALAPTSRGFDPAVETFAVVEDGLPMHVVTRALVRDGRAYFVQAALSDRSSALFFAIIVRPILQNALFVSAVSLVLFGVGIHFTLSRLLRPLRRASQAAARIDPRNLEARLATVTMPRELRPLIKAFNAALDRLEKGYRVQQEFLASAAHELKTPLALIRGQVELSESGDRESLLHDIDLMARQVHQLLHLAEVSEANNYQFDTVDMAAVAQEATTFLRRLAQRAEVHLDLRMPAPDAPSAARRADRSASFVLLKNLIENAIQHSPRGGRVRVMVDAAGVVVCDEGAGIAPEHLDELFKRFWRGPARRDSGAGLGLSICHEIARAHGWALAARNGEVGAEFVVAFVGN